MKKYLTAYLIIILLVVAVTYIVSIGPINRYLVVNGRPPVSYLYFLGILSTAILLMCSNNKKDSISIILSKTAMGLTTYFICSKIIIGTFRLADSTKGPCIDLAVPIAMFMHLGVTLLLLLVAPLLLKYLFSIISTMTTTQSYFFYGCVIVTVTIMPSMVSYDRAWAESFYPSYITIQTSKAFKERDTSECEKLLDIYYTNQYKDIYLARDCRKYSYRRIATIACKQSVDAIKNQNVKRCLIPTREKSPESEYLSDPERLYVAKKCVSLYLKEYPNEDIMNLQHTIDDLEKEVEKYTP